MRIKLNDTKEKKQQKERVRKSLMKETVKVNESILFTNIDTCWQNVQLGIHVPTNLRVIHKQTQHAFS